MRETITGRWFECKVLYETLGENGLTKQAKDAVLARASSFSQAEELVLGGMLGAENPSVVAMTIAPYTDFVIDAESDCDTYFKARVEYEEEDEKGKTRVYVFYYLVQSDTPSNAASIVREEFIDKSIRDGRIVSIVEKKIKKVL